MSTTPTPERRALLLTRAEVSSLHGALDAINNQLNSAGMHETAERAAIRTKLADTLKEYS